MQAWLAGARADTLTHPHPPNDQHLSIGWFLPAGGCNTLNEVQHILINPPLIFTMQLIWESNAENAGEIRATMDAIQEVGCLHTIIWQYPLQCLCQGGLARAYTL